MAWYEKFFPCQLNSEVININQDKLWQQGIRAVLIDLDNTLVAWDGEKIAPKVWLWLDGWHSRGGKLIILSNSWRARRVKILLAERSHFNWIIRAGKPFAFGFNKALKRLGLPSHRVAMIGDQLLTDIWGGNRQGIYTIKVAPLSRREFIGTKINRWLERKIIKRWH